MRSWSKTMNEESFNNVGDIYEKLGQDARLNPIGSDMTKVKTRDGLYKARALVNRAIEQGIVTAAGLSRRTGIKGSAISAFRNEKWRGSAGTLATTASELSKAVNILLRQRESDRSCVDTFVKTNVARAIFDIAKYAVRRRMIAGFALPAGSGKTLTLQALHEEIPGSVIITVMHSASTVKPFLQTWARALGTRQTGRINEIQAGVIDRLAGSDRMVMVDEAHKLSVPCLDVVREIYDAAKIPIILAGTPVLHKTLTACQAGTLSYDLLDQLYSRIGIFRNLSELAASGRDEDRLFSREDVREVFIRGSVRISRGGVDLLFRLANHPGSGGLRICRDLVQMCVDLYKGDEITVDLLRAAFNMKIGAREAGFRIDSACGIAASHDTKAVASACG